MKNEEYPVDNRLVALIENIAAKIEQFKIQELERINTCNLSVSLIFCIYVIDALENPTFGDLAKKLNLSKPAITVMVNKLIQQDIAYKQQSTEDQRVYYVNLTEKGHEIANTCKSAYSKLEKNAIEKLTSDEYQQLINLLSKIV